MSNINIDDYLKAIETPSITINGVTYETKPLSFKNAVKLQKKLETLASDDDLENLQNVVKELCKAVELPEDLLVDLPPQVFLEVVNSFFTSLFGAVSNKTPNPTNGTKLPKKRS